MCDSSCNCPTREAVMELLLANKTNIHTCRFDMLTSKDGETNCRLSKMEEVDKMSPTLRMVLVTYLQNALRQLKPAVHDRVEGSNRWHTFTAYRMTKTSYIFSFITHDVEE